MITFVIFTFNEADRIERVIKNFKNYGRILIADNNSTDSTQDIARQYGCEIFLRKEEYEFVENQKLVDQLYEVVSTEWIYWGFADEMLETQTLEEISRIISTNRFDIISLDRKNYFYGEFCHNLYHARVNKLFKKHAINFTDNVIHGMGKPNVEENKIHHLDEKYFIHHFISNTAASYLNVINRYTESELQFAYSVKTSFMSFILLFLKILIKDLFRSKAYRSGFSSVALTELMIFYALVKNMKHYERSNNLSQRTIEAKNNLQRDIIIEGIGS